VTVVDKETIAYLTANTIVFWNMVLNRKEFLWHDSLGMTSCSASCRGSVIAIGEEGPRPKVVVYSYPQKQELYKLDGNASVMYTAIAYSRTGEYLVTVGDYPKYTMNVWRAEKKLISVELNSEPLKVVMHDHILLTFKHEIRRVKLNKSFQIPSGIEDELIESQRYSIKSFQLAETTPLDAVFDKYEHVYISTTGGELFVLQPNLASIRFSYKFEFNIQSMVMTQRYLIVATTENRLLWLNIYIPPEVQDPRYGKNISLKPAKELVLDEPQDVVQLLYTPDMAKLVMVGLQGKLQVLHLTAEADFDAEEDEDEKDEEDFDEYDEEEHRKVKPVLVTPQVLGQFHVSCVKRVCGLGDSSQCVSIGEDLKVWEVTTGENLVQYSSPNDSGYSSMDVNAAGNIAAVGSSKGVLRVLDVTNRIVCRLLSINKLFESEIDSLKISPDQKLIACASSDSNQIYLSEATPASKFRVIGCIELPATIKFLAWMKRRVIALLSNNLLAGFEAPRAETPSHLSNIEVSITYRHITDCSSFSIYNGNVYMAGISKDIFVYPPPDLPLDQIDLRKVPPDPVEILAANHVTTNVASFSPDLRLWALGAADGTLKLGDACSKASLSKRVHGSSGVQCIEFSADSTLMYSTGKERDFFAWSLTGRVLERAVQSSAPEDSQLEALDSQEDLADEEAPAFKKVLAEMIAKQEAREVERNKSKFIERVRQINEKLMQLIAANEKAPELEKLDRDEFVLDLKAKQELEAEGLKAADELRRKAQKENMAQELLKERIKAKTWDSMEVQNKVVYCMNKDNMVHNYTIRKRAPEETAKLRRACAFRLIELREKIARGEKNESEVYDADSLAVPWMVIKNVKELKSHPLLIALDKKRDKERKEGDPKQIPEWELVYPLLEVYTPTRKRQQIYLLQMLIRALKQGFNIEFDNLEAFKDKQKDLIEEKNVLIGEKQKELQQIQTLFKIPSHPYENPEEMLKVKPEEIKLEKYLTREEREAQEEARRKEEERLRLLNADDSKKRALQGMMWGTIDTKKDSYSLLSEELVREEWMDKLTLDTMSDEQRNKFKEFQEKEKKLQEDKERLRKILDGELRTLQTQVKELAEKFDQKVNEVFILRLNTDYEIYQLELVISRLTLSLMTDKKRKEEIKVLRVESETKEKRVAVLEEEISAINNHLDYLQTKINRLESDSKVVDNYFSSTLDKDILPSQADQLKNLVKKGPPKKKVVTKTRLEPDAEYALALLNPLDPYSVHERKKLESKILPVFPEELEETDLPQGLPPQVVEKTLNERRKKIGYEKQIPIIKNHIKEVEIHKKWLEKELKKSQKELKDAKEQLKMKENEDGKSEFNTELLLKMRQAVVEVLQQPVVTDYSDAILIDKDVIERLNKDIKSIGKDKVEILKKIAKSKIELKRVEWAKNMLELEKDHLMKCETDVKMLRIDKRLQNILAGRGLDENKLTAVRIEKQMTQLNANAEKRISHISEKEQQLVKAINELTMHNEQLEDEVHEMERQMKQREELYSIKVAVSDQARHDPQGKFKQISSWSKLKDKIRQHYEEMEFLKDELDRLRAKTFPSFAHLQAHVDYPDEI
jgi:WD40 repeat protein